MAYQRFDGTMSFLPSRFEAQAILSEMQKKRDEDMRLLHLKQAEEKKQQTEALRLELNRMLAELRAMTANREATMSKFLSQTSIPHRPPFPPPEPPDLAKLFESPLLHTPAIHPRVPFSPNQNQNNQGSSIQQIESSGVKDVISTNFILSNGSNPEEESRPEEASTHKADSDFGEETITCNASKSSQVPSHVSLYHLPVFDGTLPDCWIVEVDRFFELKPYGNEEKLYLISLSLEGAALKWFRRHRREFTDWTDLKRKLMARFGLVKGCSPPEVLPMHRAPFNPYYKNPYATPLLPATETIGIPFSKPDFTPTPIRPHETNFSSSIIPITPSQPQIFVKDCEDASMSDDEANYETNSVLEKETCPSSALCQRIPATQPQNNNMTQQEELIQGIETIREIGPIQEHESPKLTDAILEVDCVHSQEFSSQFQVPIPSLEPSRRCHKESLDVVNDLSYDHGCVTGIGSICDFELGQDNSYDEEEFIGLNLGKLLKNERLFSIICLLGLNDMSCWTQLLRQQIFPKSRRFKFKTASRESKLLDNNFSGNIKLIKQSSSGDNQFIRTQLSSLVKAYEMPYLGRDKWKWSEKHRMYNKAWKFKYIQRLMLSVLLQMEQYKLLQGRTIKCKMRKKEVLRRIKQSIFIEMQFHMKNNSEFKEETFSFKDAATNGSSKTKISGHVLKQVFGRATHGLFLKQSSSQVLLHIQNRDCSFFGYMLLATSDCFGTWLGIPDKEIAKPHNIYVLKALTLWKWYPPEQATWIFSELIQNSLDLRQFTRVKSHLKHKWRSKFGSSKLTRTWTRQRAWLRILLKLHLGAFSFSFLRTRMFSKGEYCDRVYLNQSQSISISN